MFDTPWFMVRIDHSKALIQHDFSFSSLFTFLFFHSNSSSTPSFSPPSLLLLADEGISLFIDGSFHSPLLIKLVSTF